jgi:hypothetical protein
LAQADDPRFSRVKEFELMSACTSEIAHPDATEVCACALYAAQESPWFRDYDNDDDFNENRQKFLKTFGEKIGHYSKNRKECKLR